MKLSFIIVAHNVKQCIGDCLSSIENALGDIRSSIDGAEIIVVDRASTDGTATEARSAGATTIFDMPFAEGWAAAANLGAGQAHGDILIFVAPELALQAGGLPRLLEYLDTNPSCVIAGGAIVSPSGALIGGGARFPGILATLTEASSLAKAFPKTVCNWKKYGERRMESATIVDTTCCAYAAIKVESFTAFGGFDNRFFSNFASADICYALSRSMPRPSVAFVPQARARVANNSLMLAEADALALNPSVVRHRVRSEALYMWKNRGVFICAVNLLCNIVCHGVRWIYNHIPGLGCRKARVHNAAVVCESCKAALDTQLGSQYPTTPW